MLVALKWKGILSRVGALSCQDRLWPPETLNGHKWVEKNDLTCFNSSFLNVCIAHIYFNVKYQKRFGSLEVM